MEEPHHVYTNERILRDRHSEASYIQNKTHDILASGRNFQQEHLAKALEKNLSYQRLLRKHTKSLEHLLETNTEKRRVLWQTLAQVNANSDDERVRVAQVYNNEVSQKVIFSAPWFVDDKGDVPPPNPDSAHFHRMVSQMPFRPYSRTWSQDEKDVLLAAVRYATAAYHRRKSLWAAALTATSPAERAACLSGIADTKTREGAEQPFYDSEDEDDAPLLALATRTPLPPRGHASPVPGHVGPCAWGAVVDGQWQSRCTAVDVAWTGAMQAEHLRVTALELEATRDPDFHSRLGTLTPFPMTSPLARADALFFSRHNDPLTLHLASRPLVAPVEAVVAVARVNWSWVAREYVRGGRTALQCAQMWRNVVDPSIGALTDADKNSIAAAVAAHPPSSPEAAPPLNWYALAASLPHPRPPILLVTHHFRKSVSRRWTHSFARLNALRRVLVDDWQWLSRELGCLPEQAKAQWARRGECQRTGRWVMEEDLRLLLAVKAYTRPSTSGIVVSWSEVAAMVPGRNELQCRERYLNAMGKRDTREFAFTEDADERLLLAVRTHGYDWGRVAGEISGCGPRAARLRWVQICSEEERAAYLRYLRTPVARVSNQRARAKALRFKDQLRRAIRGEVFEPAEAVQMEAAIRGEDLEHSAQPAQHVLDHADVDADVEVMNDGEDEHLAVRRRRGSGE